MNPPSGGIGSRAGFDLLTRACAGEGDAMKGERTSSIKTLTVAALCTLLGALPRAGGQCVALEFDTFQPVDFTNTFGATCAMRGNIAIFGAHFDDDAATPSVSAAPATATLWART